MSAGEFVPNTPLHGEFSLRLDDKGRLTLPGEVRAQMAAMQSTALVARGNINAVESAVWLFPDRHYEELCAERSGAQDVLGVDLRMIDLAVATRLTCDKRGRVTVPETLLRYYGILAPNVTLIGAGNHLELWNWSSWQEHRATLLAQLQRVSPL